MWDTALLQEGLALMAFGMGFVFIFLTVLVISTSLMSMLVTRLAPVPVAQTPSTHVPAAGKSAENDELMVVLSAALHRYRRRHPR
ncbi:MULTISPECIES: OadG family protein [Halomonadaceae]|uniref:OadG family protein n=1 Tax=Halomonadaceae TaxID=28256 RepID=UPI001598420B|nr:MULTISPECIES: OadG family protein [Halomonas]QJQ97067.1 OadG family protein [Halomonas sp. PA5]